MENFDKIVKELKDGEEVRIRDKNRGDEIPDDIRLELDLPKNMGKIN